MMQIGSRRTETSMIGQQKQTEARIAALVGTHKRVLLLCDSYERLAGEIGKGHCEINVKAPERAGKNFAGGVEIDLNGDLSQGSFDVVVIKGVLEQMREPLSLLGRVKNYLKPEGYVIATLRNATHINTRLALLGGQFLNDQVNTVDGSPVQFFTREAMEKLFEDAGLALGLVEREERADEGEESSYFENAFSSELLEALRSDADAFTYQYLVVAYPVSRAALGLLQHRIREVVAEREAVKLEMAAMRETVEQQGAQIAALASKVAQLEGLEADEHLYLDSYNQLRRRKEEVEAINQNLFRRLSEGTRYTPFSGAGELNEALIKNVKYRGTVTRIQAAAPRALPAGATVLVASRGDEELLRLDGCRALHFPQTEDGVYAGYYPADGREAVGQLEKLRKGGAKYLLFPQTAFWWLDHYRELREHLEKSCRLVLRDEDTCAIYELREDRSSAPSDYKRIVVEIRNLVEKIIPADATVIVASKGDNELLNLNGRRALHFPQTWDGVYAGHHPADGAAALKDLKSLREAKGGDYFLLPSTALWWLEHYNELKVYLETDCRVAAGDESLCLIYALGELKEKRASRARKTKASKKRAAKARRS